MKQFINAEDFTERSLWRRFVLFFKRSIVYRSDDGVVVYKKLGNKTYIVDFKRHENETGEDV